MDCNLYNGLTLAYIGDSYFELYIRTYLLEKNFTKVDDLHKRAILYTKGESQAKAVEIMMQKDLLSEEEIGIYKRGRNCKNTQNRKNISMEIHNKSSGFEALIGYLYLSNRRERLEDLLKVVVKIVESGDFYDG